jgi:molybdenum cofactor synthesis domain-containing protein
MALMKTVPVQDAIGMVLCHDVTQIIPGQFKGPAFRKGHILEEEDIPRLLSMGKEHIYAWEVQNGLLHENEAAVRIARAVAGRGITLSEPKEGKVELAAECDGLLKIDIDGLYEINEVEQVVLATIHSNQRVARGKVVAGTRIIPLVIDEGVIELIEARRRGNAPVIEVLPFRPLRVGIVTTGSEVFHGRIEDRFGPVVARKLEEYGCEIVGQIYVSDEADRIVQAIRAFLDEGAEMITVTGGMSVDPDDVTPAGIRASGGRVVTYGAPVLPGAMFMAAYIGSVPVLGLPGCVMYHGVSIFDVVLPRILAGEEISRKDIVKLAHGGLCVQCKECKYPDCGFGKGA